MTGVSALKRQIDSISADLRRSEVELNTGAAIDLAPMHERIDALCAGLASLPSEQQPPFRPLMLALMDELSRLGQRIEERLQELKTELSDAAGRSRAVNAYGRAHGGSRRPEGE